MRVPANTARGPVATTPTRCPNRAGSTSKPHRRWTRSSGPDIGNTVAADASRYGWIGSQQRSGDMLGAFLQMGARVYNPATGRFTTPDPVAGGGATPYGYPFDPVNGFDVTGEYWVGPWHWDWSLRGVKFKPSVHYSEFETWFIAQNGWYNWMTEAIGVAGLGSLLAERVPKFLKPAVKKLWPLVIVAARLKQISWEFTTVAQVADRYGQCLRATFYFDYRLGVPAWKASTVHGWREDC